MLQFIAPDVIGDLRGISVAVAGAGVVVGLVLWITGWWAHRFWIVLLSTLAAGIFGLLSTPAPHVQPLVAGLLLAVAAGLLALALVRVVAFAAGGAASMLLVHAMAPSAWDEPLISFLVGGLIGLLLFRLWTMVLTSFAASLIMAYFGLCLADSLGKLDAVIYAEQHGLLLNWVCGGVTLGGAIIQFFLERWRLQNERRRLEEGYAVYHRPSFWDARWWGWGRQNYRRAA
jgi:MFS family permease